MRLFELLLRALFPPRASERLVQETTVDALVAKSARSSSSLGGILCTTLLPYRDETVRALILEAKFHGNKRAQELLGAVLAHHLKDEEVILLPVPLGEKRCRERGYNQTEEICKMTLRELPQITLQSELLIRVRETLPQTELPGEERRKNVAGAFRVKGPVDPAATYIVVDDVMTTGATLNAVVQALKQAGAIQISAVALAR